MLGIILSYWICIYALLNKSMRRFFPLGIMALIGSIVSILFASVESVLLHEILYWAKSVLMLGIGGYSVWTFRKGERNG